MIRPINEVKVLEVFVTLTPLGYITGMNSNGESIVISPSEYIGDEEATLYGAISVLSGDTHDYDILRIEHYLEKKDSRDYIRQSMNNGALSAIKGSFIDGSSFATLPDRRDYKGELEQLACEREPAHIEYYLQYDPHIMPVVFSKDNPFEFSISTDASKSHYDNLASWAFIIDSKGYDTLVHREEKEYYGDHYFKSGVVECKTIGEAEAYAIVQAYKWASKRTRDSFRLTIRTDSMEAIRAVTEANYAYFPKMLGGRFYNLVYKLKEDIRKGRVKVVKVKAHRDDVHNNQADRVALATRRAHRAKFTKKETVAYVKNALINMDIEMESETTPIRAINTTSP